MHNRLLMKRIVLFIACLLFGLLFISAGFDKFFHFFPMPDDISDEMKNAYKAFMTIGWLMPLVGVVEVIGGLLFIIPRTRALGAIIVFPVMVGIFLTNSITDTTGLPMAVVLIFINLWVIFEEREKYMDLI